MSDYEVPPVQDKEAVYDEQIAPLMAQILAVCKEHGIPMVASFEYAPEQLCTSAIPGPSDDETSQRLNAATELIYQGFAALTVRMRRGVRGKEGE